MVVLVGLANGKSGPEIAEAMGVELNTIRSHVSHIFKDLEVESRSHAVAVAMRFGMIAPEQIVLAGECPGARVMPNFCRCSCELCAEGRCAEHYRRYKLLGERPSKLCSSGRHTHCTDQECTCTCGHITEED
jgi:hypothetical protein